MENEKWVLCDNPSFDSAGFSDGFYTGKTYTYQSSFYAIVDNINFQSSILVMHERHTLVKH